jgi:hypothetical protein
MGGQNMASPKVRPETRMAAKQAGAKSLRTIYAAVLVAVIFTVVTAIL